MSHSSSLTKLLTVPLACLLLFSPLLAYNHPEIRWQSVTTAHFTINYYDRTEPAVYAAWKIAEAAFDELSRVYGYKPARKINLSLADYDDYSNGFADWTQGSIMIWVPDSRFDLRGSNTWLRNVICHELAHIITMEKQKRMQVLDFTLSLAYQNPQVSAALVEPFARTTFYPNWLAEGLAQTGSERMSGDCWDSRRDMILRCAILDGTQLTLDEMGHFNHDGAGNEMVYNQGYSLVRYLLQTAGQERVARVVNEAAGSTDDIDGIVQRRTGRSMAAHYRAWIDSLRSAYSRRVPASPTATTPVWAKGKTNRLPRFSPDGKLMGWFTSDGDDYDRTDLLVVDRATGKQVALRRRAHTAWTFSADGGKLFYVKSRSPNAQGSYLNDLFSWSLAEGRERRLTRDGRIYDVAASPDGRALAVVYYADGVFSLGLLPVDGGLIKQIAKGELGNQFMGPCFNPANARQLVVSRLVQGRFQLFTVDLDAPGPRALPPAPAHCEAPCWAADGRIWYNADYDGIHNIYSVQSDGTDLRRHSDVKGGLFAPAVAADGTVLCSEYTSGGFRIVSAKLPPSDSAYQPPADYACTFDKLPEPKGTVRIHSKDYEPKLQRPVWELSLMGNLVQGDTTHGDPAWLGIAAFGTSMSRSDALMKRNMSMGVAAGVVALSSMDSTVDTIRVGATACQPAAAPAAPLAGPRGRVLQLPRRPGDSPVLARSLWAGALAKSTAATATDTASDSTANAPFLIIQPMFALESARFTPTIGLSAEIMALYFIPARVVVSPYFYWDVGAEGMIGLSPVIAIAPLTLSVSGSLPLWAQWVHTSHLQVGYQYTLRDVRFLSLQVEPLIAENFGLAASGGYQEGVPVGRSCSFVPGLNAQIITLSELGPDPREYVGDTADLFAGLTPSARFVFPIAKKISRGSWLYADALYASVFSQAMFYGSGSGWREAARGLAGGNLERIDRLHAATVGLVGLSLDMGLTKSYAFDRRFRVAAMYEMVRKKVCVDASLAF